MEPISKYISNTNYVKIEDLEKSVASINGRHFYKVNKKTGDIEKMSFLEKAYAYLNSSFRHQNRDEVKNRLREIAADLDVLTPELKTEERVVEWGTAIKKTDLEKKVDGIFNKLNSVSDKVFDKQTFLYESNTLFRLAKKNLQDTKILLEQRVTDLEDKTKLPDNEIIKNLLDEAQKLFIELGNDYRDAIEKAKKAYKDIETEIGKLKAERDSKIGEIESYEDSREKGDKEIAATLSLKADELKNRIDESEKMLLQIEKEKDSLSQQVESLKERLLEQIEKLQKTLEDYDSEIDDFSVEEDAEEIDINILSHNKNSNTPQNDQTQ